MGWGFIPSDAQRLRHHNAAFRPWAVNLAAVVEHKKTSQSWPEPARGLRGGLNARALRALAFG